MPVPSRRSTRALVVGPAIAPVDVERACDRVVRAVRRRPDEPVVIDVRHVAGPDLDAIEALCRVALAAARAGGSVRFVGATEGLLSLIAFCGLARWIPTAGPRSAEMRR